jgi:small subunit ribosomal protein S8
MDPIANLLTTIRNGQHANKTFVSVPYSRNIWLITSVLYSYGFIGGMGVKEYPTQTTKVRYTRALWENDYVPSTVETICILKNKHLKRIFIGLKPNGRLLGKMILSLVRVSSPKKRVYLPVHHLRNTMGFNIRILSTTKGIMSDRDAVKANVGGEILCACL